MTTVQPATKKPLLAASAVKSSRKRYKGQSKDPCLRIFERSFGPIRVKEEEKAQTMLAVFDSEAGQLAHA
jgi:hypothetical protein